MRHLILGSSAAAVAAVDVLRKTRPDDEIIMASADETIHSRCMLHHYLSGERDAESLSFTRRSFFKQNRLEWLPNSRALSVDANHRIVNFADTSITYDKLLIATGTNNFVPDIPGLRGAANVYTLGNLKDAVVMRNAIENAHTIAILGAGLIGMDIAHGIAHSNSNATVHVIESESHIIPKQLDANIASKFQARFEEYGVKFHLDKTVATVHTSDDGAATALEFSDGDILPCTMIIVAAGTRPNVGFLENSGISLGNGVVVDRQMRTSAANVYAAGDVTGIAGNWYAAVKQGRVAGQNMVCNGSLEYTDTFHTFGSINLCGLAAVSVGKVNPPFDGYEVLESSDNGKYLKLVLNDDIVEGALIFGDISHTGHWKFIIENAIPVDNLGKSPLQIEYADFFDINANTAEFRYK